MIRQLALAGSGGGEVRLLKLDDVDTTDLANEKILKYNSTTGKLGFVAAGTAHTATTGSTSITSLEWNRPRWASGVQWDDVINVEILDVPTGYVSLDVDGTTYKLPYYPA